MQPPTTTTTRLIPLGALAILGLASCSLPPEQAWRQIRQEGLITYWMRDGGTDASTASSTAVASSTKPTVTAPMTKPAPTVAASTAPVMPTTPVPPPSAISSQSLPVAQTVPGLEGYVRTPFTNPPRLVDVRGMAAGSKVVCPYTRRPFLVPQASVTPKQVVVDAPTPPPTPAPEPVKPKVAPAPMKEVPQVPTKVATNTVPAPQPPPAPVKEVPQAAAQVKPSPMPQPQAITPPAPKVAAQQLPFGVPIPGRPGFVNSPYAAKHQLVDVTGLPTGMEVKCPYTGKLFRVPPTANDGAGESKN